MDLRCIIVVQSVASWPPLRHLALAARARGWSVTIVFGGTAGGDQAVLRDAAGLGLAAEPRWQPAETGLDGPLDGHHPDRARLAALRSRLAARIAGRWGLYQALAKSTAGALALFDRLRPDLVIVAEDGVSSPMDFLAAARHRGVPILDVPYGYGARADFDVALDSKLAEGTLPTAAGEFAEAVRDLAPQWVKTGGHAGATLFDPAYIAAIEALGITVADPWTVHGGPAARVCVDGPAALRHYRLEGVPAAKLVVLGSPYCDMVAAGLEADPAARAAFLTARPITAGRLRVLVSWPTSYHASRAAMSEFPTYREMTVAVLGGLARIPGIEVTVSPHPAVGTEGRALISSLGVAMSDEFVVGLIPRHDLYLGYYSSTMRWALAAGKPVLNYNAYGVDYPVFVAAPGFVDFRHARDLLAAVSRLASDPENYHSLASLQAADAPFWGAIDGKATGRILDLGADLATAAKR